MSVNIGNVIKDSLCKFNATTVIVVGYISFVFSSILYRNYFLDDAFIHLAYARNFIKFGYLTGDGASASFMSSPGYLFLSLPAVYVFHSVYFLKIAGFLIQGAILLYLNLKIIRAAKSDLPRYLLIFMAFCSPLAVRWLQDGMDTSIFAWMIVLISSFVDANSKNSGGAIRYAAFVIFGVLATLIRIEALYVIMIVSAYLFIRSINTSSKAIDIASLSENVLRNAHLAIGGCIVIVVYYCWFGAITPDTAIAKQSERSIDTLYRIIHMTGASLSFGCLLCLSSVITSFDIIKSVTIKKVLNLIEKIIVLAAAPACLLIIIAMGMRVESIRHIEWVYIFGALLTTNYLAMSTKCVEGPGSERNIYKIYRITQIIVLLSWTCIEIPISYRLGRSADVWIANYKDLDWSPLIGKNGMAFDVGLPWYYSRGLICDLHGLIGGRNFARLKEPERWERCYKSDPSFAILIASQYAAGAKVLGAKYLADWYICATFGAAQINSTQADIGHILFVSPKVGPKMCPSTKERVDDFGELPARLRGN